MIDDEDVFVVPPQVRRAMYARRGWQRGATYDGGVETDMSYPEAWGEQQIVTSVTVHPAETVFLPVLFAELAADLLEARA